MRFSSLSIEHKIFQTHSKPWNYVCEFVAMKETLKNDSVHLYYFTIKINPYSFRIYLIFLEGRSHTKINWWEELTLLFCTLPPSEKGRAQQCPSDWYSYLLICRDTCGTENLLGLAGTRATIAIAPTVLTTVHGEVVGRMKFWKTGIATKTMYHILIFNFKSNLGKKNTHRYKVSRVRRKRLICEQNLNKDEMELTSAFFWHILHLAEMLLVYMVTTGFFFSS